MSRQIADTDHALRLSGGGDQNTPIPMRSLKQPRRAVPDGLAGAILDERGRPVSNLTNAMLLLRSPGVGEIDRLPLLPGVKTLRLLEERDPASKQAVQHCTMRWADLGREVVAVLPKVGKDKNDALRAAR